MSELQPCARADGINRNSCFDVNLNRVLSELNIPLRFSRSRFSSARQPRAERYARLCVASFNSDAIVLSFFPGDVSYKPYISGEPEIRCVPLDGTEDFLIIACDGLWDYVDPRTAALRVYRQVLQNPRKYSFFSSFLVVSV